MPVWKDDKIAAQALSGKLPPPKSSVRLIVIIVALALLGGVVLLVLNRSPGIPAAASKETVRDPKPAAEPVKPEPKDLPVSEDKPDVIRLPPVILGQRSSDYGADKPTEKPAAKAADSEKGAKKADSASARAILEKAREAQQNAGADNAAMEHARTLFQQALESGGLDEANDAECLSALTALTNKLILDPKFPCTAPKAAFYKVEQGDNVEKIARNYKVNQGQLKVVNRLNDKLAVRYGQSLKILPGEVVYQVDRTRLIGTLYIDGVFIRRYPVGIGPGNATPPGTYVVERKVTNPDWYYDGKRIPFGDPVNILGTRWMAFAANEAGNGLGLGVHGTALPASVPGRESKGCVRMRNNDVEELYDLMPQGGKVVIAE